MNVTDLQGRLTALGYAPGPVDGKMGKQTREALRAFQSIAGIEPDGKPGPKTEEALLAAERAAKGRRAGPLIDPALFAKFAPKALAGTVEALEQAARKWGLLEPLVLAHWLGQMHVESRGFSTLVESLNYSVDGLLAKFGRHRISEADARRLGRIDGVRGGQKVTIRPADQRAIANLVYGGKWGRENLGNVGPNAGWDNRGSGFKQITGEENITESGFTAEQLRTDVNAAADAAGRFFVKHGCVPPARADDVEEVTERVNGGHNGLPDRVAKTKAAKPVVGA